MYYRRKFLLAFLEVFNGSLKRTDCEKLLFNFCQSAGKNYYNFFPYQFGPFSFMSYFDKRRLTELGFLEDVEEFKLKEKHSYLSELQPADQKELEDFQEKFANLRGKKLVKETYKKYPEFAARSKIIGDLFSIDEVQHFQTFWNDEKDPLIFTIGYEGITIDSFLYKLIKHNIKAVVDVRHNPHSMKYGFSKKSFKKFIENAGMKYIHIRELGIPSSMRKGLGTDISHDSLFQKYETELLPHNIDAQTQLLELIKEYPRIALVCFEADHHFCHRNTLVEHLQKKKPLPSPVLHI
jgi:uncharacterized protein (DUF488 family)